VSRMILRFARMRIPMIPVFQDKPPCHPANFPKNYFTGTISK
jgi:hypothetical protein